MTNFVTRFLFTKTIGAESQIYIPNGLLSNYHHLHRIAR